MVAIKQDIDSFLSSNALNIVAVYAEATTYAAEATVRELNRIYKSVSGSNLGNYPPSYPYLWMDWEASNEHAMLDLFKSTVTNFAADGIVVFSRGTKDSIAITNFNASEITIEYLDDLDVVLETTTYSISSLGIRVDDYSYIYADFDDITNNVIYAELKRLGTKIRVTFKHGGAATFCGSLVAGKVTNLGDTLDKVSFSDRTIAGEIKKEASFSTTVDKTLLNNTLDFGRIYRDVPMLFVIDPSENSSHQNLAIIAKITSSGGVAENMGSNTVKWILIQN